PKICRRIMRHRGEQATACGEWLVPDARRSASGQDKLLGGVPFDSRSISLRGPEIVQAGSSRPGAKAPRRVNTGQEEPPPLVLSIFASWRLGVRLIRWGCGTAALGDPWSRIVSVRSVVRNAGDRTCP